MNRQALKDLMYGGIEEMTQNPRLFYRSSVGKEFNSWTDEGHKNLAEFMNYIAVEMANCRRIEDDNRAKEMVLKELKS